MEGDPIGLQMAMPIAVAVAAAFGNRWRPSYYWALALLLAVIPLVERAVYVGIAASVGQDVSHEARRQLALWAGFYALPIALVFGQARLPWLRARAALSTLAGVGTYLAVAVLMSLVFIATKVMEP